LFVFWAL